MQFHLFYTICETVLVSIFKARSIKEGSVNCDLLISALNNQQILIVHFASGGKVNGQNGFGKKFQVVFSCGLKNDYPFPQGAKCYWLYYSDKIKD